MLLGTGQWTRREDVSVLRYHSSTSQNNVCCQVPTLRAVLRLFGRRHSLVLAAEEDKLLGVGGICPPGAWRIIGLRCLIGRTGIPAGGLRITLMQGFVYIRYGTFGIVCKICLSALLIRRHRYRFALGDTCGMDTGVGEAPGS